MLDLRELAVVFLTWCFCGFAGDFCGKGVFVVVFLW
jgi:hypothetical protein